MQVQEEWRKEKVAQFAARMEEMALRKAGKGSWLGYTLSQAMGELMEEMGEVGKLLHKGDLTIEEGNALQWECVDVAISAMILADLVATFPYLLSGPRRYPEQTEQLLEEDIPESGYLVDQVVE